MPREECGQSQTWRTVKPASRQEGKAADWNALLIGMDDGTDSLCTSADLEFVSYGAKLCPSRTPRPIPSRVNIIPWSYTGDQLPDTLKLIQGETMQ